MLVFMYVLWLFVIYCVSYKALVANGKYSPEILTPSIACLILSVGGIRPFGQSLMFVIVYLVMTFVLFFLDLRSDKRNQN